MFILRDIPTAAEVHALAKRYPDLEPEVMLVLLPFLRAAAELFHASESHFARYGTSCGRFTVLALLNRDPDRSRTPSEIAGACGVTRATITGLLDGLEHDRLISRERSAGDRRSTRIQLTAQGRRFLDRMLPDHFRRMSQLLAGINARDRAALGRASARITGNVSSFTVSAPARH